MKFKLIKVIVLSILSLGIVTTAVFAVNNIVTDGKSSSTTSDSNIIAIPSTTAQNNISVTQATYGEKKALTKEEILKLYNQGYGLTDIEKAEKLSIYCGKTPDEVLKLKGKANLKVTKRATHDKSIQAVKNTKDILDDIKNVKDMTGEYGDIQDVSKKWVDVIKELGIDENKLPTELKENGGVGDEN